LVTFIMGGSAAGAVYVTMSLFKSIFGGPEPPPVKPASTSSRPPGPLPPPAPLVPSAGAPAASALGGGGAGGGGFFNLPAAHPATLRPGADSAAAGGGNMFGALSVKAPTGASAPGSLFR
jgi:hypothetical protein